MSTQRDRLVAVLDEAYGVEGSGQRPIEALADALLARGVRAGVDDLIAAVEAVIAQADHNTSGRLWEYEMGNLKRALAALEADR